VSDARRNARLESARAALKRGEIASAENTLRGLYERRANDAEVVNLLGTIAVMRGMPAEAITWFEQLTRLQPRDAAAAVNLARVRLGAGDARGAMAAAERGLRLQPGNLAALATCAEALNRLGETQQALAMLDEHVRRGGEHTPELAHAHAVLLSQAGQHDRAAALARTHFESTSTIDPSLRRLLGFALGQALDAQGDCERAFEAFAAANAVPIPGARFDPADFLREIDQLVAFFSPARLRALQRATERSSLPVIVTGMARSGTTLVEQILARHPAIFGAGELSDLDQLAGDVQSRLGVVEPYPQCLMHLRPHSANTLGGEYLARLRRLAPESQRVVDKNLHAVTLLGFVWLIVPGASIIHCRRDPLANGLSCFMSALSPRLHPYASDLRHIGLVHRQIERLMAHWRDTLDLNVLCVEYEELVAQQEARSREIIAHIGLEWDERCLRFHEAPRVVRTLSYDQVRRPIYSSAVERHKRYDKFLEPLKRALAGE